jgi:PKD repeat protein
VCAGDTVQYASDIDGAHYKWVIVPGTGGTFIGPDNTNPVYVVWNTPGTYIISVTIVTSDGQVFTCKQCVVVTPGVTAVIDFDPNYTIEDGCIQICNNTAITLNSSNSYTGIINSEWDFGDGYTTTGTVATHTYTIAGTYTITLTVHSECCSDTAQYCVTVDSLSGPDIFCISPVCGNTEGVLYCTNNNCTAYDWTVTGGTISGDSTQNCVTINWGVDL